MKDCKIRFHGKQFSPTLPSQLNYIPYSGYFSGGGGGGGGEGVNNSWFLWLSSEPRNIYPRMISLRGYCYTRVHDGCGLDITGPRITTNPSILPPPPPPEKYPLYGTYNPVLPLRSSLPCFEAQGKNSSCLYKEITYTPHQEVIRMVT